MKISILTLFPKVCKEYINESIIKNAIKTKKIDIEIINFRDYSKQKNKQVDDYQYGGGPGMVLMLQPIADCLKAIRTKDSHVILLSPQGNIWNQQAAKKMLKYKHIILIAGRYEGFDERIEHYVDEIISIGDYVLTGGEIPALIILDSITRLIDNVINNKSLDSETFTKSLLDYPIYTKPKNFEGHVVPDVLLSGNHKKINEYRKNQQIKKTKLKRQDLYKIYLKGVKNGKNK